MKYWNRYWSRFWELPTVTEGQPQESPEVLPGREQLPPTIARQVLQQPASDRAAFLRQEAAQRLQASLGNRNLIPTPSGQPLSPTLRARLEASLDTDLSAVRLYQDEAATQALNARAFTVDNSIILAQAADANNLTLLGHEAVHIAQAQKRGTQPGISQPGSVTEQEADTVAKAIATNKPVSISLSGSPVPAIQRQAQTTPTSAPTDPMMQRETVRMVLMLHYQKQGGKGTFTLTPALKSELSRLIPALTGDKLVLLWTPEPSSPMEALQRLIAAGFLPLEPTAPQPEAKEESN